MATLQRAPGRRSQAESARTRDKILNSAERLFAQQGFGRTPLRAIAQRAGVHQKTIHHHFGSKAALYREVLDRWSHVLYDQLAAAVRDSDSLASATERVVDQLFDLFLDKRDWVALTARAALGERLPRGVALRPPPWARFARESIAGFGINLANLDIPRLVISAEGLLYAHALASARYRQFFGRDVTDTALRADTKRHLREMLLRAIGAQAI